MSCGIESLYFVCCATTARSLTATALCCAQMSWPGHKRQEADYDLGKEVRAEDVLSHLCSSGVLVE